MPDTTSQAPYVLAIDAGTEAIKAGLFDLSGRRVAIGVRRYATYFPGPAWAEQDPEEWWHGLVGAVRDCLQAANVPGAEILGIAADATTCTLVPVTAAGRPLRRAFLWMDVRAGEQARRLFASGDEALRYCLAGAYTNLARASQCMVEVSRAYVPDPARHAEYAFYVRMYQETYRQMRGLMHNMNDKLAGDGT